MKSSASELGQFAFADITPESQNLTNGTGGVVISDPGNSFGDVFKDIAQHQILSVSGKSY